MQRLRPAGQALPAAAHEHDQALEPRGGREEWARDQEHSQTQTWVSESGTLWENQTETCPEEKGRGKGLQWQQ